MHFFHRPPPSLNLALQGGGAHGAFTWGVLDALLADGRIQFDGVSGTSAGAMNAVVLAQGLMAGGREGARAALQTFWNTVASSAPFEVAVPSADGKNMLLSPTMRLLLQWSHYFSPDQLNPFDLNPLRDIITAQIDFEQLRQRSPVHLFIAATHANSGKLRLFRTHELTPEMVLASACLPTMHRSIVIDGEPYWDGGYSANPAVFPLFEECKASDIMLVMLAPLTHKLTPSSAKDIRNRMMELAFNATFLREMRMFAHLREHVGASWLKLGAFERRRHQTHFHVIEASELMAELSTESKLAANMQFFGMLKELGQLHAQTWLNSHFTDIGKRSSADLSTLFN
jgi:NTE family protein